MAFTISDVLSKLNNTQKKALNREIAESFKKVFGGGFGNYINKRLRKDFRKKIDILVVLKNINATKSAKDYELIFSLLEQYLIDYYEIKITSYFYNRISGNKKMDSIFKIVAIKHANIDKSREIFKKALLSKIENKTDDVIDDLKKKEILTEKLNWVQYLKSLGSKEKKLKYHAINKTLDLIPSLNYDVKKLIKQKIFLTKFSRLEKILDDDMSGNKLASIIGVSIFQYFVNNTKKLFQEEDDILRIFKDQMNVILDEKRALKDFNSLLGDYLEMLIYLNRKKEK